MTIQEMYIPSVNEAVKMIVKYYNEKNYNDLRTVKQYLETEQTSRFIAGDADRFHNATVALTRIGFYDYAYALAEVGHSRYPNNTDLLGDLLYYGLQCRNLSDLEKWYICLGKINERFWTWRAYQFSFDYWMTRLPDAVDEPQLQSWEENIESIISSFKDNFRFLGDKSDCEKAYLMEYEYLVSKGDEDEALSALVAATTNNLTKNKCPQCAMKLADHYFEIGDYAKSLDYANLAVSIKEDQPSISLGYTHYIRAMSLEYVERKSGSYKQHIQEIYNAFDSAFIYLKDESDRQRLIDSIKRQVRMLERESSTKSNIMFEESSDLNISELLRSLGKAEGIKDS